jgi:hypothetical protein
MLLSDDVTSCLQALLGVEEAATQSVRIISAELSALTEEGGTYT